MQPYRMSLLHSPPLLSLRVCVFASESKRWCGRAYMRVMSCLYVAVAAGAPAM